MKVLRVEAPGASAALTRSIEDAVRAFNAGLDIRLRFLSIGIEETAIAPADAAAAAEQAGLALAKGDVDLVLVLGEGEAALAAAAAAARAQVPLVRVGAGRRTGPHADANRGVDRLAASHLAHDKAALAALAAEGISGAESIGEPSDPAAGERVVRALTTARRRDPC